MKRVRLLPILGLCLCLVACGSSTSVPKIESVAAGSSESTEGITVATEQASEADSIDEAVNSGNALSTEEPSQYDIWIDYIDGKDKAEITLDEESERLYSGFLKGEVAAECMEDCTELCDEFSLPSDQKKYTLPEIESMIEIDRSNIVTDKKYLYENYLDIGLDGSYELMVDITNLEDPHGYGLCLILKNYDGKLKICAIMDCWARCNAFITYPGIVETGGSGGAMSHSGSEGYLDADGKYHLWYSWDSYGYETYHERPDEEININGVRIGGDDIRMFVNSYTFYDDKEYVTINIEYINPDKQRDENSTDLDEAYEKAVEAFIDPGEKLCTEEEIGDIIEKYRKKLGISDEVYTYGDELKPEDD